MVGRSIKVLSKTEYAHVRNEYGEIINASEISNSDNGIDNVWNEYNAEKVPDIKYYEYQNSLLTGNDRNLNMSWNYSRNLKENFSNHKRKHNVSLSLYHETNIKIIEFFLVDNKTEYFYESEVKVLQKTSVDIQLKYLKYILNSMNAFILSLVIYFLGSRFRILSMSWHKSKKTFRDNIELVMKKYLCSLHD